MKVKILEKDIVRGCLELLAYKKIPAFRINSGAFKTERGGFYRMSVPGMPDIIAILPRSGVFCGIECKTESGKISQSQEDFKKKCEKAGGLYWIIRDPQELVDKLSEQKL